MWTGEGVPEVESRAGHTATFRENRGVNKSVHVDICFQIRVRQELTNGTVCGGQVAQGRGRKQDIHEFVLSLNHGRNYGPGQNRNNRLEVRQVCNP